MGVFVAPWRALRGAPFLVLSGGGDVRELSLESRTSTATIVDPEDVSAWKAVG